ncbi:MAG: nucleotide exchange factor GrpE [Sphingomonadales bacterium]|jgi:molecular chaperone GrpE
MANEDKKAHQDLSEVENQEAQDAQVETGDVEDITSDVHAKLETVESEVADLKDRLLRAVAETENIRRRSEREKADASSYAVTGFARELLNVADNLRRALEAVTEEQKADSAFSTVISGVEMTERELLAVFERHGIRKVIPEGEKFDHNLHQAMFEVPTNDTKPGTVCQVMQPGYVLKDRLLRPALVGVAKAAPQEEGGSD